MIFTLDNALPLDTFYGLQDELQEWTLSNYTDEYRQDRLIFTTPSEYKYTTNIFYKAATHIKLRAMKHIKKPLALTRIHTNATLFGQGTYFHVDSTESNIWTVVLFTTPSWDIEWGGELVVKNLEDGRYQYIPYIPNTAAILPANWEHCGFPPSIHTSVMRTSLSFCYQEVN